LIIGAGMAGAALSKRLSEHGVRVVCLEQGRWIDASEHPHESNEWEFALEREWARNPNNRRGEFDYPIRVQGDRVDPMLYNAVGGSTVHYNAHWPRLKPVDFRKGTEHGLAGSSDWPLSYEELAPYYELNDREIGVSGVEGDPGNPPRERRQTAPLPLGRHTTRLTAALNKLGWHWWPADCAIITADYDGRAACIQCGACRNGCPRGSLGMASVTYWPKAIANGVELRTHARVEQVLVDKHGTAAGAVYVNTRTGDRVRQRARVVIVAANGLGTPRLLLLSATGSHPNGLGNSSRVVGRYLMHHAYASNRAIFDEPVDSYAGAYGAPILVQHFYDTDPARGFVNGFTFQVGRGWTASAAALSRAWGTGHRAAFARTFNHDIWFSVQTEDLPVYDNRVELDVTQADSSGLPGVSMTWQLHPNDERIINFGVERAYELAVAAGAVEMITSGVQQPNPAWHMLGTCRMGHDPSTSVTDRDHQVWDVPNLYVCDGSSFVTGGSVNPTSTIGALALRCADRIVARQKGGAAP
jgi:choline dehydrogenase-like flavoprotein